MPFTFAHPALVLPLSRLPDRWISASGVFIGSMAPDFEYFLRLKVRSQFSHTIAGIFLFNLPLCFVLFILFHQFVRAPLIHNLPGFLRVRFIKYEDFCWQKYAKRRCTTLLFSILLGVSSHLLWDSFTHADGYFAELLKLDEVTFLSYSLYTWLQHGSTLTGFLFIACWVSRLEVNPASYSHERMWFYWPAVFFVAGLLLLIRGIIDYPTLKIGHLIVSFLAGLFSGLLFSSYFAGKWISPPGKEQPHK